MQLPFAPQLLMLLIPVSIGLVVQAGIGVYAWRHRDAPGARSLAFVMLYEVLNTVFYIAEFASPDIGLKVFWDDLQWTAIFLVMGHFVVFSFEFGRRWVRRGWLIGGFYGLAAVVTAFVLTDRWHHLYRPDPPFLDQVNGITLLRYDFSTLFWVILAIVYLSVALMLINFIRTLLSSPRAFYAGILTFIAGLLVPFFMSIGFETYPGFDISPIGFAAGSVLIAWGLFRLGALDIVPLARSTVWDSIDDAVLVFDRRGRVVDANNAASRLIGRQPGSTIRRPVREILPEIQSIIEGSHGGEALRAEVTLSADPQHRTFELGLSTLVGPHGEREGQVAILRDVTRRRQLEHERERLIKDLKSYSYSVAHDLRNPLALVLGHANLLANPPTPTPGDIQTHATEIVRSSEKMNSIVESLLLLANVRENEAIAISPIDTGVILSEVSRYLAPQIAHARGELVIQQDWPPAVGYAPWVEAIWVNFIGNALKYGGSPPHIEVGADPARNGMVRFWVRDNGPGIPPEAQARLFEEFYRHDSTRAHGHGLGLSIAERIAERLGGSVGVESAQGRGSLFYFTLPSPHDTTA